MKKRFLAFTLTLALMAALLPVTAQAVGAVPIYIGYTDVDYMAEEILKQIPTAGLSAKEQIRAVYDWIIKNCNRNEWDGNYYFDEEAVYTHAQGAFYDQASAALENGQIVIRRDYVWDSYEELAFDLFSMWCDSNDYIAGSAYYIMMTRYGDCGNYSALLAVLLGHLGFDCRQISGEFINSNGSMVAHQWNCVLVDGQYYWLDVRIDHSMYDSSGKIGYYYFMEPSTAVWENQHSWDRTYSDWLAANSSDIAQQYIIDVSVAVNGPWSRCSDWARPYMDRAGERGLIPYSLYGEDLTKDITRAEFCAVAVAIYEALTQKTAPYYSGSNPFSDTSDYYVLTAYGLGIVNGVSPGEFAPKLSLTREQAVTMLGRVYELSGKTVTSLSYDKNALFDDDSSISQYAKGYIYYFAGRGIIGGVGNNLFAPSEAMTREQAVKIAIEAVDRL